MTGDFAPLDGGYPSDELEPAALLDLPLRVWAEVGRTRMPAASVVGMAEGSIVDLDCEPDEPADLYVNGRHFGTVLDEHLHDVCVALIGGLHERRRAARRLFRIRIGAVIEQRADGLHAPGARGEHQRLAAERKLLVGIRAVVEQRGDHLAVTMACGEPHRCRAIAVRRRNVGASFQQQFCQAHVAVVRRPMQRRGTIGLRGLHVGAALHEPAHLRSVAPHRGIRDRRLRER
jgi:hypothetical protein